MTSQGFSAARTTRRLHKPVRRLCARAGIKVEDASVLESVKLLPDQGWVCSVKGRKGKAAKDRIVGEFSAPTPQDFLVGGGGGGEKRRVTLMCPSETEIQQNTKSSIQSPAGLRRQQPDQFPFDFRKASVLCSQEGV